MDARTNTDVPIVMVGKNNSIILELTKLTLVSSKPSAKNFIVRTTILKKTEDTLSIQTLNCFPKIGAETTAK